MDAKKVLKSLIPNKFRFKINVPFWIITQIIQIVINPQARQLPIWPVVSYVTTPTPTKKSCNFLG